MRPASSRPAPSGIESVDWLTRLRSSGLDGARTTISAFGVTTCAGRRSRMADSQNATASSIVTSSTRHPRIEIERTAEYVRDRPEGRCYDLGVGGREAAAG